MTDYRVVLPEEKHTLVEFRQDDLPAVAMINSSLTALEHKVVFSWHLSLIIELEDLIEKGMPSPGEREIVDPFGDELDRFFRGDSKKPNALFLARVTWNGTRQLLYRVYDPESIHRYLQDRIEKSEHPRPFDYRIDPDPEWKLATWYLDVCAK